jgi:hypothetical protein
MQHNDCTYISTEDTEIRQARYRYYQYIISEANLILNGSGGLLVFVRSPLDIDRYINEHPNQSRIGFIVEKPDCIKSMSLPEPDTHVSPIYFARDADKENFVQFDSALGQFFLLPEKQKIQRKLFYSPDLRQASRKGCFEDAVVVLMKLLCAVGIVKYCENNSSDNSATITTEITKEDYQQYTHLEKLTSTSGIPYYLVAEFTQLARRVEYQKQLCVLLAHQLKAVENIYVLTRLPKILMPNIERFDTMRNMRVKYSEQFFKQMISGKTVLEIILKMGVIRNASVTVKEISDNLSDSNSRYDFSGRSFPLRYGEGRAAQQERCKNVFRLFRLKTGNARIANNIAEFATGKRFSSTS